jgi:hypothetical protein
MVTTEASNRVFSSHDGELCISVPEPDPVYRYLLGLLDPDPDPYYFIISSEQLKKNRLS